MQQVVLHDVAQRPHFLVERAPPLDAEVLGHRDLHVVDVLVVPDRIEEAVGEAKVQKVLHRFLAEVVVDAEDRGFREHLVERRIERARAREVAAEGLLDDDPRVPRAAGARESVDDRREHAGRDREVVERTAGAAERRADPGVGRRIRVVTLDVLQEIQQLRECGRIDAAVLLEAVARALAQLLEVPAGARNADHRNRELAATDKRLQRGKDLLMGEITGRTKEHERIGAEHRHPRHLGLAGAVRGTAEHLTTGTFVRWPPPSAIRWHTL